MIGYTIATALRSNRRNALETTSLANYANASIGGQIPLHGLYSYKMGILTVYFSYISINLLCDVEVAIYEF